MQGHPPQLIITLSPAGTLQVELPCSNGTRRIVPLSAEKAGASLLRMLHSRGQGLVELGFDGDPTQQQVYHWEHHHSFPRDSCRFCIAEGRTKGPQRAKQTLRQQVSKLSDGVVVQRCKPAAYRGAPVRALSLKELGL